VKFWLQSWLTSNGVIRVNTCFYICNLQGISKDFRFSPVVTGGFQTRLAKPRQSYFLGLAFESGEDNKEYGFLEMLHSAYHTRHHIAWRISSKKSKNEK